MFVRKIGAVAGVAALAASGLALTAGSASAAVPTTTGDASYASSGLAFGATIPSGSLIGMGSDTTQFVMGQLAAKYNEWNAAQTTHTPNVYSLAACDPEAKGGVTGVFYDQPCNWTNGANADGSLKDAANFVFPADNGKTSTNPTQLPLAGDSGSGAALLQNVSGSTVDVKYNNTLAFSRASGPQNGKNLKAYPFAVDSVVMVTSPTSNAPANLTKAQILGIYDGTYTDWSQLGGKPGAINAYLPANPSSGTYKAFTGNMLKVWNNGTAVTLATTKDVKQQYNGKDVIEHDPTAVANDPNAIAPFSLGRVKLTGDKVKVEGGVRYDRAVYNNFRTPNTSSAANVPDAWQAGSTLVESIFGQNGWICTSADAKAIIEAQGFFPLKQANQTDHGTCGVPDDYSADPSLAAYDAPVTTTTNATVAGSTVTATISAASAAGKVTFALTKAGSAAPVAATDVAVSGGKATFTIPSSVPAGSYKLGVAYSGDAANEASSADTTVTIAGAPSGGTTVVTPSAETAAHKKLTADKAKLKKLKKQYKKAHGHKKTVLKKKITKLNKAIKKDKKLVAAGK